MRAVVLVLSLLLGRTSAAESGVIRGVVSDASTKQPMADVVVTATALDVSGEHVVVTDAAGQYRIPTLPAGDYTLRFEKEAFQPYSRSDIALHEGHTLRVMVAVVPADSSEVITISCGGPTIDVGSTSTGVNVGSDFMRNLPLHP